MTDQHEITPPTELADQWCEEWRAMPVLTRASFSSYLTTVAANWGWDQRDATVPTELQQARDEELEACCEWLRNSLSEDPQEVTQELRAARRPKPLSLKEEALSLLNAWCEERNGPGESFLCDGLHVLTIRRALEQLDD